MNTARNVKDTLMPKDILSDSTERSIKIRSRHNKWRRNEQKIPTKKMTTRDAKRHHESSSASNSSEGRPPFKTKGGELVKSRGELLVADFLHSEGLKYAYERPIRLGRHVIVRPDFYLKRYDVVIEFWGMLDDENYQRNSRWKVSHYKRFGVKFIELEPEDLFHLKERFYPKLEIAIGRNEGHNAHNGGLSSKSN